MAAAAWRRRRRGAGEKQNNRNGGAAAWKMALASAESEKHQLGEKPGMAHGEMAARNQNFSGIWLAASGRKLGCKTLLRHGVASAYRRKYSGMVARRVVYGVVAHQRGCVGWRRIGSLLYR